MWWRCRAAGVSRGKPLRSPPSEAPSETPKVAANETKVEEEKSAPPKPREKTEPVRTEVRKEKKEPAAEVAAARQISPEVRRAEPPAPVTEHSEEAAPAPAA